MMASIKKYSAHDQNTIRLYTLEEAEKIISTRRLYFLKQRVCGLLMILIGIICPILFDGDATFSLLAVPLGIYLLVTKQQVMSFKMLITLKLLDSY